MKKTILFAVLIALFFSSCEVGNTPKPEPLLSQEEMVELLYEVRVIENYLYREHTRHYKEDSIRIQSAQVYKSLFKKYEITYEDYEKNIEYYLASPAVFEEMLQKVAKKLDAQKVEETLS